MIIQKSEFKRGEIDCLEIYDNDFKILEKTTGSLWNTDKDHAIVIAKSRINDYMPSLEQAEPIKDLQEEEIIND